MYATETPRMVPPIDMFGDASQMLSAVGANPRLAVEPLTGAESVLSFGAFALPGTPYPWEVRALRRKVQAQVMRSVVEAAPSIVVIALEVAGDGDVPKARMLGRRLTQDVPYVAKTRYGHRLSTAVVLVRGEQGRESLAAALRRGDFHGPESFREVVIDADCLSVSRAA